MRHRIAGRLLNRDHAHRQAMWRNMVTDLIVHERIVTTVAKAKELRKHADRVIRWGKDVSFLICFCILCLLYQLYQSNYTTISMEHHHRSM